MSTYARLPAPSPEQGLSRYLQEIRKFPMLEPEEEYMLAKRWVETQDTEAAQIVAGGFELLEGPFAHPYYAGGYGAVYTTKSAKPEPKLPPGSPKRSSAASDEEI